MRHWLLKVLNNNIYVQLPARLNNTCAQLPYGAYYKYDVRNQW